MNFVETWDLAKVAEALEATPNARMICLESPTNPLMRVCDIRGLAKLAKEHGALVCVDNSVMSPVSHLPRT